MKNMLAPSFLLVLISTAPAQAPTATAPPTGVDITRSAGLQPAGPGRLTGGGHRYMAEFSSEGMRFVPALGAAAAETRYVRLRCVEVARGGQSALDVSKPEPTQDGLRVSFERAPGVTERFDVGVDAVELSWRFAQRPSGHGDLVVRYSLATNLPEPTPDMRGGLSFVDDVGGVTIGAVTGIDARGRQVPGALTCEGGVLSMSLPAAFVDDATYPIVLDPLVGSTLAIGGLSIDTEPDLAYDATNDLYLAVWQRNFSTSLVVVGGQRVTASGTLTGNTILLATTGVCGRPRVANFPARARFGVVFRETLGFVDGIRFEAIDAGTGATTHQAVLASSTGVDLFDYPDIGGAAAAPLQSSRAFVTCYEDNIQNEIRVREVYFDAADQLVAPSPVAVFSDVGGVFNSSYTQPAMSRQSRLDSRFLIAARRFSGTGPSRNIAVRSYSTTFGVEGVTTMDTTVSDELSMPDIDGQDGSWTLAWERTAPGGTTAIRRRRVDYDGAQFSFGPIQSTGGAPLLEARAPAVAWSPARTRIGYRNVSGIGPQASLRLASVNTGDSAWCEVEFNRPVTTSASRIVATTEISGGTVGSEEGMLVFSDGNFVVVQRLINHGSSGTLTNLGGQCGAGGSHFISPQTPGIGTAALVCNVTGLSNTAVATVFNFSTTNAPVACGPCAWEPFGVVIIEQPVLGVASVAFPIPCLQNLIGTSYVMQWTTFDPAQSPCGLFPGVALSDRVLMTIGN